MKHKRRRKFEIQILAFPLGCIAEASRILCQDLFLRYRANELSKPSLPSLHYLELSRMVGAPLQGVNRGKETA